MSLNLRALIAKLNDSTRLAMEAAAGFCLARTHYDVEIEHYLLKLLDRNDADFVFIAKHFGVDTSRLTAELTRVLDDLKSGNGRTPTLSPSLLKMMTEAWTVASIDFGAASIRSGITILALLGNKDMAAMIAETSRELNKIHADVLRRDFLAIVSPSKENIAAANGEVAAARNGKGAASKTPNLDQYTVDLTKNARKGKIDAVLARDPEIRQVVDILTRRRQNNPILVGEAGVGKTAVVEGFALRIAAGEVPSALKKVSVRMLDLALLQAGAGVKGEFENRLKSLIQEVTSSSTPIVLFIDEAHTMIGAGGQAGQNDAANILKPALARGELRTIAATTWSEYKKYFEKDPALARRFQVVKVAEPSEVQCALMLRGVLPALEKHHGVRILDEGLLAAVRLSHRYLPERQLPDKAVSVLDTACARLALSQNSLPPVIEDGFRVLEDLAVQTRILERESATGGDHAERLADIAAKTTIAREELEALNERWAREQQLVNRIRKIRVELEVAADGGRDREFAAGPLRGQLAQLNAALEAMQGEAPLTHVCVDAQLAGEVVSAWTGIPIGKMLKDEIAAVLSLEHQLAARIIGQEHALQSISQRIRTARAELDDPGKPVGVFLLAGPSGVGKTETALALSDLLFGGEHNLITINMSEFQEAHTVSTLKGSPPGYVGYGEGGVLTEAVRRRPYSVVLLDEVEKAHPDVLELFFQVFDKGRMEDGEGREIDFRNTIIILTSNAGTETIMKLTADAETAPTPDGLVKCLKPELDKIFKPAFLGRLIVIPYLPIRDAAMKQIIRLKIARIQKRILDNHRIALTCEDAAIEEISRRCTEVESGARNIDNILTNTMLPEISRQILAAMAEGRRPESIRVGMSENGFSYLFESNEAGRKLLACHAN
jgi:type VI secretion system protein VasG